jgi:hypothetical protein
VSDLKVFSGIAPEQKFVVTHIMSDFSILQNIVHNACDSLATVGTTDTSKSQQGLTQHNLVIFTSWAEPVCRYGKVWMQAFTTPDVACKADFPDGNLAISS